MTKSGADDRLHGIVTVDPAAKPPHGTTLRFEPTPITTSFVGTTATINNWHVFEGIVLLISFADKTSHYIEGSAVLIAPGIALCATHVIEPRLAQLMTGSNAAMCHGLAPHGLLLWHIRKVTVVAKTDITILGLELASAFPPGNRFPQAMLTTRTPRLGEDLLLCGFRASAAAFPLKEGRPIEAQGEIRIARGPVTNRFPFGRDNFMIPWPTIEVGCPARGGMSGGPVFDSTGHLIGLICSSIEFSEQEGISYVSLLWPALTIPFESSWLSGAIPPKGSLLELDPHLCHIERRESVRRVSGADENELITEYHAWEK